MTNPLEHWDLRASVIDEGATGYWAPGHGKLRLHAASSGCNRAVKQQTFHLPGYAVQQAWEAQSFDEHRTVFFCENCMCERID